MPLMFVNELIDVCQSIDPVRPSTLREWHKAIKPIADMKIEDVTKQVALTYRASLLQPRGPLKQNTLKARIATLKGLWNRALDFELITGNNPWLKADKKLKYVNRSPEAMPWEFYRPYHDDPFFVFLWYTGARIGEVAGLDPQNIVLDAEIPYFNFVHQENRMLKNDDSIRKTPIHPNCFQYIPYFRPSKAKEPGRSWSETFRKNLGLPKYTAAHSLRHSFISRCCEVGISERIQDHLIGHAPQTMTARYGKVSLALLNREVQKI